MSSPTTSVRDLAPSIGVTRWLPMMRGMGAKGRSVLRPPVSVGLLCGPVARPNDVDGGRTSAFSPAPTPALMPTAPTTVPMPSTTVSAAPASSPVAAPAQPPTVPAPGIAPAAPTTASPAVFAAATIVAQTAPHSIPWGTFLAITKSPSRGNAVARSPGSSGRSLSSTRTSPESGSICTDRNSSATDAPASRSCTSVATLSGCACVMTLIIA
jgi:hypothetical protein